MYSRKFGIHGMISAVVAATFPGYHRTSVSIAQTFIGTCRRRRSRHSPGRDARRNNMSCRSVGSLPKRGGAPKCAIALVGRHTAAMLKRYPAEEGSTDGDDMQTNEFAGKGTASRAPFLLVILIGFGAFINASSATPKPGRRA